MAAVLARDTGAAVPEYDCDACGQRAAPARCSRCQSVWYCGSDCQRNAWKTHKSRCSPPENIIATTLSDASPSSPSQVRRPPFHKDLSRGLDADALLTRMMQTPFDNADESRVVKLCQEKQYLDALGCALWWQMQSDEPKARQMADMLWNRVGFEPVSQEKHKYSILHAQVENPSTSVSSPPKSAGTVNCDTGSSDTVQGYSERRYAPEFVGFRCHEIDAQGGLTCDVLDELRGHFDVRSPTPCVIKNLPLFPRAVEKWDVTYLAEHMGEQLYHTFASNRTEKKFGYFFDERNEGNYVAPPLAEACKMTFKDFISRAKGDDDGKVYYLQTPVLRYEGDQITCAKFDGLLERDLRNMNNKIMSKLSDLGSFGPISRNQLFVSFADSLTASHYDQQHNVYLQIRGAKRFLLFDPALAPALYPYPAHHPLDRKARFDVEAPDFESFPRSRALLNKGVEALVEPGDILFIPMSWFHLVHSVGEENVSLNWWFYDSGVLFEPAKVLWPLSTASALEYSRHVEYFAAEQVGPINVEAFMSWCFSGDQSPSDTILAERWRLLRNYVFRRLSLLPPRTRRFVLAYLDVRRWSDLPRMRAEPKAVQGLRDVHGVANLLEGLQELQSGLFRSSTSAQAVRALGDAIDCLPREKLRTYLECCEELLQLLKNKTDWDCPDGKVQNSSDSKFCFNRDEARRAPLAILRGLRDLSAIAGSSNVRVSIVDNGFFANWLQVLDARLFSSPNAAVTADWVLTGQEKEFNYGLPGQNVFTALFDQNCESAVVPCAREDECVVQNRQNFLFVNVFRGQFLTGKWSKNWRRTYSEAAKTIFKPTSDIIRARDHALASVPRESGIPLIGVHKRVDNPATARMQLAQVLPCIGDYVKAVKLLAVRIAGEAKAEAAVILLATDDEAAVGAFKKAFGSRLIVRTEAKRSFGGVDDRMMPVEVHGQRNRLTVNDAKDCLVDALLLAKCDAFVHGDSNLTIAAGIMNPDSEAVHIRELVPGATASAQWPGYRRCRLPF